VTWRPTHADPLFILAMDHRDSFGKTLFDVRDDKPTDEQLARMRAAKSLIYAGLRQAARSLPAGRTGVLVDEQLGADVIAAARGELVLAIPIEASGHEWFTLEYGDRWLEHVRTVRPDYAKVLVRDNPAFPAADRSTQLDRLATVSSSLHEIGVPFLYELLVPATDDQLAAAGGDVDRYDRDVRPELVVQVIADNQKAGVRPTLWKVEGLETVPAAEAVAAQAHTGGADLIVLGRDAPTERLNHWLEVAGQVEAFVGFAIGRSIWEDVIRRHNTGEIDEDTARAEVADRYLAFTRHWPTVHEASAS
jgi:myo-inositol catabolism protein IolC